MTSRSIAAVLALVAASASVAPAEWLPERLVAVDGDTLRLGAETIRIIGVDTPETGSRAKCSRELALGMRSTEVAEALVTRGEVLIERKRRRDGRVAIDRYGRTLAVVTINAQSWLEAMRAGGAAIRQYSGRGRRRSWCETGG